ncbi:hypothetical protein BC830DRAFT_1094787 [Chytriomyces sp. MP71]|nr:hypothetical protein BC830DRAFT_1094787 [Chytriomyces sp. MP71]
MDGPHRLLMLMFVATLIIVSLTWAISVASTSDSANFEVKNAIPAPVRTFEMIGHGLQMNLAELVIERWNDDL